MGEAESGRKTLPEEKMGPLVYFVKKPPLIGRFFYAHDFILDAGVIIKSLPRCILEFMHNLIFVEMLSRSY